MVENQRSQESKGEGEIEKKREREEREIKRDTGCLMSVVVRALIP
jgi:hypothetical protein